MSALKDRKILVSGIEKFHKKTSKRKDKIDKFFKDSEPFFCIHCLTVINRKTNEPVTKIPFKIRKWMCHPKYGLSAYYSIARISCAICNINKPLD
jgi:hypothetical protein